jgi:hypothetical protein
MLRRRLESVVRDANVELEAERAVAEQAQRQSKRPWWKPWQR